MPHRRRPPQTLAKLRLLLRLRLLKLRIRPKRRPLLTAGLAALLLVACGERPEATPERPLGHVVTDQASGVGLDLPGIWAGRYAMGDSITVPADGLERELAFRFRRADSTLVAEPLIVVRIITSRVWRALPPDTAAARFGTLVAQNDERTVAVRTASANPLAAGSADALAFDSLMMVVLQRPLRASLRPAP